MSDSRLSADEIEKMFKEMPTTFKKIIRKRLREDMKPVRANARAWAPVEEGDLQRAIVQRAGKRSRNMISQRVFVDAKKLDRAGDNEASNRLAGGFQEYGTKHIKKDPFMLPAWQAYEQSIKTKTPKAMVDELRRIYKQKKIVDQLDIGGQSYRANR